MAVWLIIQYVLLEYEDDRGRDRNRAAKKIYVLNIEHLSLNSCG